MKKILLIAAAFVGSFAVNAQELKPEQVIKVNTEKHDFGKIKHNVPVTYFFEITNVSDKAITIENAWGTCGCTTPEIPKPPIAPGATAKLKVQYNAAAVAPFEKDVFIKIAGVTQPKNVKITGEVLEVAAYDAYIKDIKQNDTKKKAELAKLKTPNATPKKGKTTTTAPKKVKTASK